MNARMAPAWVSNAIASSACRFRVFVQHGSRDACLVHVETNKVDVTHQGVPFAEKAQCFEITAAYSERDALL